jgi:hypothetical protein
MAITIFSFQRAFSTNQRMALAAADCETSLAAIEQAKDILDSLYLGLDCEITDCDKLCDASSAVDQFIAQCNTLLQQLSEADDDATIPLPGKNYLFLYEKNGHIHMSMNGEHVILPNLTLRRLYKNLVQDILNNPDLYGSSLASYAHSLERRKKIPALLLPSYAVSF